MLGCSDSVGWRAKGSIAGGESAADMAVGSVATGYTQATYCAIAAASSTTACRIRKLFADR